MIKRRQGDQVTDHDQSLVCSTMVSAAGLLLAKQLSHGDETHVMASPSIR